MTCKANEKRERIECIRQEFIAVFLLRSKTKRVNTATVFALRSRWQGIILQNRIILQKQEFMQMMDFPEAILTEQNSEGCWQILNWG